MIKYDMNRFGDVDLLEMVLDLDVFHSFMVQFIYCDFQRFLNFINIAKFQENAVVAYCRAHIVQYIEYALICYGTLDNFLNMYQGEDDEEEINGPAESGDLFFDPEE